MMVPPTHRFAPIFESDQRYAPAAYFFVFDALRYAQEEMGLGVDPESEEHHVTGQDLCEAIRRYAQDQFGLMAKCVLNSWGIHETGDFGEIVYNLIQIGQMKKSPHDQRQDFDNVFDFEKDLKQNYQITLPK